MENRSFPSEMEGSVCGPFLWDNREPWEVLEHELAHGPTLACRLFLLCFVCFICAFLVCCFAKNIFTCVNGEKKIESIFCDM